MNIRLIIQRLQGLFQNPAGAWREIGKMYFPGSFAIIRDYFLFFFLLIPAGQLIRAVFAGAGWKIMFLKGVVSPLILLCAYLAALSMTAVVMDEVSEAMKLKNEKLTGTKIAYFSGLPLVALSVFLPIPYVGMLFFVAGFVYQLLLIHSGCGEVLGLQGGKRAWWLAAVIISLFLMLFLFGLLAGLIMFFYNFL